MHSHKNLRCGERNPEVVLILVVMEDALAHKKKFGSKNEITCLNPCCNGRCTRTEQQKAAQAENTCVLILVVMEDALALG